MCPVVGHTQLSALRVFLSTSCLYPLLSQMGQSSSGGPGTLNLGHPLGWLREVPYGVERVGAGSQGLGSGPSCSYHSLLNEHLFVEVLLCAHHWENISEQDLIPPCLELL